MLYRSNFEWELRQLFKEAKRKGTKLPTVRQKVLTVFSEYSLLMMSDSDQTYHHKDEHEDLRNKSIAYEYLKSGYYTILSSDVTFKISTITGVRLFNTDDGSLRCEIKTTGTTWTCTPKNFIIVKLIID